MCVLYRVFTSYAIARLFNANHFCKRSKQRDQVYPSRHTRWQIVVPFFFCISFKFNLKLILFARPTLCGRIRHECAVYREHLRFLSKLIRSLWRAHFVVVCRSQTRAIYTTRLRCVYKDMPAAARGWHVFGVVSRTCECVPPNDKRRRRPQLRRLSATDRATHRTLIDILRPCGRLARHEEKTISRSYIELQRAILIKPSLDIYGYWVLQTS